MVEGKGSDEMQEYLVEFPTDEQEEHDAARPRLKVEEENHLADKISKSLILKHPRGVLMLHDYSQSEL